MSEFLRTIAKYSPDQPRWPEGTRVDGSTGAGGGRWRGASLPHLIQENLLEGYSDQSHLDERGWIITSNVDDAVRALHDGRHVELLHVREVATLLDKLAAIALAAEELGEQAPIYDLCKVSVRGTNLFCAEAFDIARDQMPQFLAFPKPGSEADRLPRRPRGTVDAAPAFLSHLQNKGYSITETYESASFLRASQRQLNGAKVGQMIRRMREPDHPLNDAPPMLVSEDNYIIDGHHRWAAYVGMDAEDNELGDLKIPVVRVGIRVLQLLEEAKAFTDAFGMMRSNMHGSLGKACDPVAKDAGFEVQHPRHPAGAPKSQGGEFRPKLTGSRQVAVQSFEYKRPGVRHINKVNVLFNPTAGDLRRWAGRDIKQVRWFKWATGDVAVWNAYESTHQQLADALVKERTATEQDFEDAYWNVNMGFNNGPNFMSGDTPVAELLTETEFYDDVIRKSWLDKVILFFKDASSWVESDHPRGKTTPESNSGSFRPSDSTQGELFNRHADRHQLKAQLISKLQVMQAGGASPQELAAVATKLAKVMAAADMEAILGGSTSGWITKDALQHPEMGPMVETYLIALQRETALAAFTGQTLSEEVRQDLAFGDDTLRKANWRWASALDNYIGNGYDEINNHFRGVDSSGTVDENSDEFKDYVSQFMSEEEDRVISEAQTRYMDDNLDTWISEDDRQIELESLRDSGQLTEEQFDEQAAELRDTIREEREQEFYDSEYYSDTMADLEERARDMAREAMIASYQDRMSEAESDADQIRELINSRPATPTTLLMRRGIQSGKSISWDTLKAGDTLTLSGFTSVSSKADVAERWGSRVIEFVVPAGSKDVLFTTNDHEGEVILNHEVRVTVLHRSEGRMVVYLDPAGNDDDEDDEDTGAGLAKKSEGAYYIMNFGRLHTEPVIVPALPVSKREWDESEHPRGKTTPESNAGSFRPQNTGFVSPNIDEGVNFDEAAARQTSERTKLLQTAAREAAQYFGVSAHESVGIGAWADGAEQSLIVSGEGDPADFKAYMAFMGLIGDQKAVVDFTNDSSGPDTVYRLSVGTRSLKDVHQTLLKAGVQFHTLRQTDHNVDIFVFSPGTEQETTDAVARAAQEFGRIGVAAIRGRGEFVGSWDSRKEGRAAYEEVLGTHGRRVHGHDRGWQALRDRWLPRLAAVRKSWLQVVKAWREEDHPRGKTTPESNSGSFSPAGDGVKDIDLSASKPPKEFYVWRVGDPDDGLVGRNAGTLEGVLEYLSDADDELTGTAPTAVKFKVTLNEDMVWGGYEHRSGDFESLSEKAARKRGIVMSPRIGRNERGWLSFPRTGFTATPVETVPVDALRQKMKKSWLTTLLKYIPSQPRWPAGTPVDEDTGAGGGRWAPSSELTGYSFQRDENGKPLKGGQWLDKDGKPVSADVAARIKAAGIPAGYHDIVLNADPTAPCLAIGKDAKGREKRFFSKAWHEGQAQKKWEEAKRFNQALPEIRRQIEQALNTARGKDLLAAQVLYVLDLTGYRIGGGEDELADKDAFGITTITSSHVKVNGDKVSFNFPGKKGVQLTKTIEDAKLARIVQQVKSSARRNQPIFDVSASKVNSYFKELTGQTFSAKDYRTWHGTALAIIEMNKWKTKPRTEKEMLKRQRAVLDKVADWLGNTRAVAKSSYVDPTVWTWWQS